MRRCCSISRIVLEDAKRLAEAADTYRAALAASPDLSEAHYNLALLCEAAGLKQEAIRHLSAYRKLSQDRRRVDEGAHVAGARSANTR